MNTVITTTTNDALVAAHIRSITNTLGSAYKGISTAMLIEEAKKQMREGTCHFVYRKADNSIREAWGCLTPSLLSHVVKGTGDSPETWGCCYYFDIQKGASRSFRWSNLLAVLS